MKKKMSGKGRAEHKKVAREEMGTVEKFPEQKKPVPVVSEEAATTVESLIPKLPMKELIMLILLFAVVEFMMIVTVGRVSICAMLLCLAFTIRKSSFQRLAEHISLPVLGFLGMLVMYGAAAIYSPFGETAVLEMFRGFAAFSVATFVLLRCEKRHVLGLLWGFVAVVSGLSFLALEGASTSVIYDVVAQFGGLLGANMSGFPLVSDGRIQGVFNNANVQASLAALALFVGLYQVQTEEKRRNRVIAAVLLGLNALVFFLTLSRGGILSFGLALIAYLVLTQKGERLRLFFLMFICAGVTMAFSLLCFATMGKGSSWLPLLCGLVCGLVIFLLDGVISAKAAAFFGSHKKILWVSGGTLAALGVAVAVAAVSLTGPATLGEDGRLWRAVPLEGGTYTYEADMDQGVAITINVIPKRLLLMGSNAEELVFDSRVDDALVIPDDAGKVILSFYGEKGTEIRSFKFSDGTTVKLDYKLLPENIASRLQDNLLKSASLLLRMQYIKDALKLWTVNPLFGRGLTSTDNLYTSVQPIYYQTKFAHSHILQYMADMGLVGTAFFLLIVVGLAWLLLRKWKRGEDSMATMFLAVLVMMNVHGFMDFNFSVRAYSVAAYLLLAIMTVAYGEPLFLRGKKAVVKTAKTTAVLFWAVLIAWTSVAISYRVVSEVSSRYQTTDHGELMKTLEKFIAADALDDDYFKIMYLNYGVGVPQYTQKVDQYALTLRNSGTFTNCDAVARYYYLRNGELEEAFASTREGIAQKAADKASWNLELDFYRSSMLKSLEPYWEEYIDSYIQGVLDLRDYLISYNQNRLETIELTEENQAFIDTVIAISKDTSLSAEAAYEMLDVHSYAESEVQ